METIKKMKVFIMEDEGTKIESIREALKNENYQINFFSKGESVFELLKFSPDIVIHDFFQERITNLYQWNIRY